MPYTKFLLPITSCYTIPVVCYWLPHKWYVRVVVEALHYSAICCLPTACGTVAIHFYVACNMLLVAACHAVSYLLQHPRSLLMLYSFNICCRTPCSLLFVAACRQFAIFQWICFYDIICCCDEKGTCTLIKFVKLCSSMSYSLRSL